ncbi:ExbD/TolR family protein [Larkinella arboricola]|uniref:Biopolymer transport protein ExbD/TolR n=1 Tax=Larkinella arboricola TaxID=643671 RepID=A0A327X474_LARAB|nr:biopolymer transporter ExbD [Larkinella arboricola]RAJ97728.1 biopolymer transport protein ExbD/TolR [Larkinella arboricola]
MPIVKPKRSAPTTDMTAMCDMAFMLLSFFIMTAQFRQNEAAAIETPTSISGIKVPDTDIMTISLDKNGQVFFGIDNQEHRRAMLENIGEVYGISFSDREKKSFGLLPNFGMPVNQLKSYLALRPEQQKQIKQPGIPVDSTANLQTNQLAQWVFNARKANSKLRIAVKGDNLAKFPSFKNVLSSLQSQNINKFNLITGTEAPPAGWTND